MAAVMKSPCGPERARPRLVALDVARALALVGIVLVHVMGPHGADGGLPPGYVLGNSVAPALFALLSGVSLALVSGGARPFTAQEDRRRVRVGTVVRALLVAVVGFTLASFNSSIAVILVYFSALWLVALPLLWLRVRTLLVASGLLATVGAVGAFFLRPLLPPRGYASPFWFDLLDPGAFLSDLLFTGYYPVSSWLVYLLLGLALGRSDLTSLRLQLWTAVGGLVGGMGALATSRLFLSSEVVQRALLRGQSEASWAALEERITPGLYGSPPVEGAWQWLFVAVPHSSTPFDLLATASLSLSVVGALLLLWRGVEKREVLAEVLRVFFGAGTMTLSLYSLHVFLASPLSGLPATPSYFPHHVAVLAAVGAVFAWARKRGPLEHVAGLFGRPSPPGKPRES